jgi:hypothetical protein
MPVKGNIQLFWDTIQSGGGAACLLSVAGLIAGKDSESLLCLLVFMDPTFDVLQTAIN